MLNNFFPFLKLHILSNKVTQNESEGIIITVITLNNNYNYHKRL